MQIQLKQSEIETALKQFIARQGISLSGKSVEITFTAGRKENGIQAELDINEIVTPSLAELAYINVKADAMPTGTVIRDFQAVPVNAAPTAAELGMPEVPAEPEPTERVDALVPESLPEPEVAAEPSKSLFG